MANPWTGEVALTIDGKQRVLKLTLGALAELEQELGAGSLVELVQRFEGGAYSSGDVLALIVAGLRGGGADVTRAEFMHAEIHGGPMEAAKTAAELLARAFMVPSSA
ncbi:gene transfer agent family protein [Ruegeria atlantica]|uniref:gene transfer agent family protein n=1 Tax=Ruegeria atlantica TaxID=81569 RepID=UPI0014802E89|nr:gene transfer agent family protein [Ruegeria atlantica]